jgi:hypothetical protein
VDVDAYYGNSLTGEFRKLGSSDIFNEITSPAEGSPNYRHSNIGVPAPEGFTNRGTNPNNNTHFTFAGAQVRNDHIDHCNYWWDPSQGVFDEFRMYDRVLSDDEIRGLFMLGCGSQPHTQACDQIYANMVGAGASIAHVQEACGGSDPMAVLYGINTLI